MLYRFQTKGGQKNKKERPYVGGGVTPETKDERGTQQQRRPMAKAHTTPQDSRKLRIGARGQRWRFWAFLHGT